jgi:hypothetical protein
MGGKTFPDLNVPRMPPELYEHVSAECQSKLETIFNRVVVPRDAPAKVDYGDIDFLVEGHTFSKNELWDDVQTTLGAENQKRNGGSTSFAIPHPEIPGAHLQIDVELSPGDGTSDGAELFEWTKFMKGDSDMMQIIGITHRALGLTCTDQGLYVRIEDIFPDNKDKAKLFLTRDPHEAMNFYGLDTAKYWTGFKDETELFNWCQMVDSSPLQSSTAESRRATIAHDRQRGRCTRVSSSSTCQRMRTRTLRTSGPDKKFSKKRSRPFINKPSTTP